MKIIPETLRKYREMKNLTQESLARLSKVTKKTISRLELGEVSNPRLNTVNNLAKTLSVDPESLSKPYSRENKEDMRGYVKLKTSIPIDNMISVKMVHERYGVSTDTLVRIAPLLFTVIAEQSLEWRKKTLSEALEKLTALDKIRRKGSHMAFIAESFSFIEGVRAEKKSIESHDIFGLNICDDDFADSHDSGITNPFVNYILEQCEQLEKDIFSFDDYCDNDHMPDYEILPKERYRLMQCNYWAEFAVASGYADLSKMPTKLLKQGCEAERIEWLVSKIPEKVRQEQEKYRIDIFDDIKIDLGGSSDDS